METRLGFRPACSNPSRRTTLLLLSPRWRSPRRGTASSRLPARNEHRSTNSSPAISRPSATHVRSCGIPRPDTSAAGSRSARSCRWARRASAISVSTNGSAAQKPHPASANRRMAPKSKNAKVTLVYQHELPNCPGKSIKGVLVEYGPGGYSPSHTHAKSAFIYATVLEGAIRSQVNDGPVTTYEAGQSFSELPGDRHGVSAIASETKPAKLLAVFVVDTNETQPTIPFGN